MSEIINQSEERKTLYYALGFTLAFFLYLLFVLSPNGKCFAIDVGSNSLGLTFSYTQEMVQGFFGLRTQEQLLCYSQFLQIWDVIFAIIYTLMYATWIKYLFNKRRLLMIVPILGMIADWSENFAEILMLKSYFISNSISETLVSIGSGINSFKWIMSSLTYLIILVGIIIAIIAFIKRKLN
jgi:hypothetical protein